MTNHPNRNLRNFRWQQFCYFEQMSGLAPNDQSVATWTLIRKHLDALIDQGKVEQETDAQGRKIKGHYRVTEAFAKSLNIPSMEEA